MSITLGNNLGTGEQISLSPSDRGLGTYVIGLTGTGKSTMLLNMIVQDIEQGRGLTLLDPHGGLALEVLHHVPSARSQDVIYLDFGDTKVVPGFDIFCSPPSHDAGDQASQQAGVVESFHKLLGADSWGPRIYRLLNHIAVTFRENPGCTLTEMPYLLTSEAFRHFCMKNLAPMSSTYTFWESYDRKSPAAQESYIESTMSKIDAFVNNPILKHIMGQPGKVPDFKAVLRDRKILIVRMPRGVLKDATRFVGYLFADRLLNAAFARETIPERERTFHAIYCDEFQYFATPDFEEFIAGGRKYGIGLLLAHQWRDQLDREMQAATVAARSRIVFQVNTEDAPSFSRGFAAPAIPNVEQEETIPPNPWDVLKRKGHPDHEIVRSVQALQQLLSEIETRLKGEWYAKRLLPGQLKTAVLDPLDQFLNRYLYERLTPQFASDATPVIRKLLIQSMFQLHEDYVDYLVTHLDDLGDKLRIARMDYAKKDQTRKLGDISHGLSSLPSYHAKCKLMQDGQVIECTIKTNLPADPQSASIAQAIIAESRRSYCTSADEVDRKLRAFQRELEEIEREDDEPNTGTSFFETPPTRF